MPGQVDPAWRTWVCEHGGTRSGEAAWLLGVFEPPPPGIGRQKASIAVEGNGVVPDWCQGKAGDHRGLSRIDTWERVCVGVISVHVGALL